MKWEGLSFVSEKIGNRFVSVWWSTTQRHWGWSVRMGNPKSLSLNGGREGKSLHGHCATLEEAQEAGLSELHRALEKDR